MFVSFNVTLLPYVFPSHFPTLLKVCK